MEDATELTLLAAIDKKANNPSWTLKTDDWGYFQRAYERKSDAFWSKYNVFEAMLVTGIITGVYWFIISIVDLKKYSGANWETAIKVS